MTWNYRLLAHQDGEDWYFQIHGVFYDGKGNPVKYTTNGESVGAESMESVKDVLQKMNEATDKPILSAADFPKEWSNQELIKRI